MPRTRLDPGGPCPGAESDSWLADGPGSRYHEIDQLYAGQTRLVDMPGSNTGMPVQFHVNLTLAEYHRLRAVETALQSVGRHVQLLNKRRQETRRADYPDHVLHSLWEVGWWSSKAVSDGLIDATATVEQYVGAFTKYQTGESLVPGLTIDDLIAAAVAGLARGPQPKRRAVA